MRVEVGKEIETAGHRLKDIIFFCEKTCPAVGVTWEEYNRDCLSLIARSAKEAAALLDVVQGKSG